MSNSKKLTLFLALIISFSLTYPANSSNIVGSKCPKIGSTKILNKEKYTCIKVGKTLSWQKVILKVEVIKTIPSPVPTTSPAPTGFQVDIPMNPLIPDLNPSNAKTDLDSPITVAARKDLLSMMIEKSTDKVNIQWIIDPNMDKEKLEQYQKELEYSVKFFGNQLPPKTSLRVYVGMSANFQWLYDLLSKDLTDQALEGGWLEEKLARSKIDGDHFNGGAAPGYSKDGTAVLFFNAGNGSHYDSNHTQIATHEYTHVVQRYLLRGNMSPMLCWMREGQATYFGYSLSTRYSTAAFRNSWLQMFEYADTWPTLEGWRSKSATDWTNWFYESEKKTPAQCDPFDNYLLGAIAWEYLYGNYGHQVVSNFMAELIDSHNGTCDGTLQADFTPCPGWKKTYFKYFGNKPEDDYMKFGLHAAGKIAWALKQNSLYEDRAKGLAPKTWLVDSKY